MDYRKENHGGQRNDVMRMTSLPSTSNASGSAAHRPQETRRSSSHRINSMKQKISEENVSQDESATWEERTPRFPARDEGDTILRKVRSVLNKISSVNYMKLRKRWVNLIPTDPNQLVEVIRLVVSKAIDEPMYQCIYSRLMSYSLSTKPSTIAKTMRSSLIAHIHNLLKRLTTDMEIAKFNRTMDRDLSTARHRKVMLHRFIAELFVESVCSSKFMTEKIMELVGQSKRSPEDLDDAVECLCVLLTFGGAKLEETKGSWLDDILSRVNFQEIVNSPTVSKRIQFMVLDVIEMKSKGWVPHNKWWTPSVDMRVGNAEMDDSGSGVRSDDGNEQGVDDKCIHEILNKVVPGNMKSMIVRMTTTLLKAERSMSEYGDLILEHVSGDPRFIKLHTMFLAKVTESVPRLGRILVQKISKLLMEPSKSLAGILFLTEWYTFGLVTVGELIGIMNKLLAVDSPPVEFLCAFFLILGQKLNSVPRGRLWLTPALRKLEGLVADHEYRLKCFVWDVLDLHQNNWERIRSLNWIQQYTMTEFHGANDDSELESILRLLDKDHKRGLQALRTFYGTKERNIDKFAYNAVMWAIGHGDVEMMKVTGRCIRNLSGVKGLLTHDKLRGVVSNLVMVTASSTEMWNRLGILMSELYSTQ